jgi:hypothetical protein
MELQYCIDNIKKLTLEEYNNILEKATDKNEFRTVVFIYDHMKSNSIVPSDKTYNLINKLHSKTIKENDTIKLPTDGKAKLQPRRRIHKIMKGYNYSDKYSNAKTYLPQVLDLFPKDSKYNKIEIAKSISKKLSIDMNTAKLIVTAHKRNNKVKQDKEDTNVFFVET